MFKLLGHTVRIVTGKSAWKSSYPPQFSNEDTSFIVIMNLIMPFLQKLGSVLQAELFIFYISFILVVSFIAASPMDCIAFRYAAGRCSVLYNI